MLRSQATQESLPGFLEPMLLSAERPEAVGEGMWAAEVKFDGIRAQLRVDGSQAWCVRSPPGRDCTKPIAVLSRLADPWRTQMRPTGNINMRQ
jgi:ATP-dependent DNA ligase